MARQPRDARIETREARKRLKARKEPYWRQVHKGLAVGYYRGVKSGSWHVRRTVDGRKVYQRIARADDYSDSDGGSILSYGEAVKRAMTADKAKPATPEGKYTVKEAVNDYLIGLSARSPRGYRDAELRLEHHVIPKLGKRAVAALTRAHWLRYDGSDGTKRSRLLTVMMQMLTGGGESQRTETWQRLRQRSTSLTTRERYLSVVLGIG